MQTSYKTIADQSEGIYREKGSKFIAISRQVGTEDACSEFLQTCKSKYHDARHHCYAYVLGEGAEIAKSSDDGEPGHSAGDPILGQLRSMGLTNTMVVVVRYFGGTKLGVSGLINAYKSATQEALLTNRVVKVDLRHEISIKYPYTSTNLIMKFISDLDAKIESTHYSEECKVTISVLRNMTEKAMKQLGVLKQRSLIHSFHQHQSS